MPRLPGLGLTFGTISALFGLANHIMNQGRRAAQLIGKGLETMGVTAEE